MTPLLEVEDVAKTYVRGGLLARRRVAAVDGVSLTLDAGTPEIVAVIGESGSGKTTLARMILGLVEPTAGRVRFEGRDLAGLRSAADRRAFMRRVQPIFQNPFEAFNPLKRVERYLFATARSLAGAADPEAAVDAALRQVGLSLAELKGRHPHELSGGQLQRVAIARALVPRPRLIVADEPVSMVDASLRMAIVGLFRDLTDRLGLSILYITHDLATAYHLCDRVLILRAGRVVETGPARQVLDHPHEPYSAALRDAVRLPTPAPLEIPHA